LGQLVSETNAATGEIYIYTYDKAGNITKKDIYVGDIGNLTDTVNYTYSTSAWGDLLTNYDGNAITYDSMGNPTKWGDAIALNWDGRNLVKTVFASNNYINYTYNSDGIRTRKYEYNGAGQYYNNHTYVLDGSTIVKETIAHSSAASGNSTTTLEYYYDESGVSSFRYNGTLYYYVKNLQGDVIGIMDSSGVIVVEYTYDAWGNILFVTGSLVSTVGQVNPFRYRGYYYDAETGWYYLQTRYYDPAVRRFISPDSFVSTGRGLLGFNMFIYCGNNPVMFLDSMGNTQYRPSDGSLEGLILQYHEWYWYGRDNFGFVGDIFIDGIEITNESFVRAMQNVGFRATPALVERYNEIVRNNPSLGEEVPESIALIGCVTVSVVEVQVLCFKIQPIIAVDRYGNVDKLIAVSVVDSIGLSIGSSVSASTAKCNEDLTGLSYSVSETYELPKNVSLSQSVSYSKTGVSYAVSVNYGVTLNFGPGIALTYTIML